SCTPANQIGIKLFFHSAYMYIYIHMQDEYMMMHAKSQAAACMHAKRLHESTKPTIN
uniref:Uncharacterized protein n=1 Tax=Oryza brachyantha TaxID=4533 RepID=J3MM28_ORYBR